MPAFITLGLGAFGSKNLVAPVVTIVSPEEDSDIAPDTPLVVDITDDEGLFVLTTLRVSFVGRPVEEVIFRNDGFAANYVDSTRVDIANGYRFTLVRTGGWPASPIFDPDVVDAAGNKAE